MQTTSNTGRQIKAMLKKNILLKRRMKGQMVWEILLPVLIIVYMKFVLVNACSDQDCDPQEQSQADAISNLVNPIVVTLVVPSIFSVGQRFVLQTMVDDKVTKMRETLRLMSLSQAVYSFSFFLTQGIFAVLSGIILGAGLQGNDAMFPANSSLNPLIFGVAVMLFGLGMIPYCMALSTLFSDSKMANQIGGLLLLIPELIYLWVSSKTTAVKWVVYAFYWLPVMPASTIFVSLTTAPDIPGFPIKKFVDTTYQSVPLAWACLILNIPLWLMLYQYFDAIMPSTYGISKSCCFCFQKQARSKPAPMGNRNDLEENS